MLSVLVNINDKQGQIKMNRLDKIIEDMKMNEEKLFFTLLAIKVKEDLENRGIIARIEVSSLSLTIYQTPQELKQEKSERYRTGMKRTFGRAGGITHSMGFEVTEESEQDKKWLTSYFRSLSKLYNLDYEYRSRIKKKTLTAYHQNKKIYIEDSETIVNFNTK
tara:strand:- start:1052 stop:1540 length:489 start_codon:yes stop_codon:yes gene_type:complete